LLYVLGWIGQGYSSAGIGSEASSISPSPSKSTHLKSDHFTSSRGEDEELPSSSSNSMQKIKRSSPAPVLLPASDIMREMQAAAVDSQPKNLVSSIAVQNTNNANPISPAHLRSTSASQTTKRIDPTPRASTSLNGIWSPCYYFCNANYCDNC